MLTHALLYSAEKCLSALRVRRSKLSSTLDLAIFGWPVRGVTSRAPATPSTTLPDPLPTPKTELSSTSLTDLDLCPATGLTIMSTPAVLLSRSRCSLKSLMPLALVLLSWPASSTVFLALLSQFYLSARSPLSSRTCVSEDWLTSASSHSTLETLRRTWVSSPSVVSTRTSTLASSTTFH